MPNMVKIFTVTIVLATNTKTLWLKMMLWKYETNHNQNTSREWRIYMGSGKEKNKWSTKRHSWNRNISCHGRQCVTAIWASSVYKSTLLQLLKVILYSGSTPGLQGHRATRAILETSPTGL